ncbi:hypothetical protein D3C85_923220 [compost metagenome]
MRFGQQLRQWQVTGSEGLDFRVGVRIVSQELTAKPGHDSGERGADLPGTDYPHGLAVQVETGQAVQAEITFAGAVVGAVQAPVQRQNQGHGMLGNGVGGVGWHAHDAQAQAFRRRQVDVVVAGRAQGNQPRTAGGQLFQYGRTEVVIDKGADHLESLGQGRGVQAQACGLKVQFDTGVRGSGKKTVAVIGLAAEENRAHGWVLVLNALSLTANERSAIALGQALIRACVARRLIARSRSSSAAWALGSCCLSRVSLRWHAARNWGTPQ